MGHITFKYIKRIYYYKDKSDKKYLIFHAYSTFDTSKENDFFLKVCKTDQYVKRLNLSDDELLKGMEIVIVPSPDTYPKFNNEKPFKIRWNDKFIINPIIKEIRWTEHGWEYRITNIGHEYDFQPERDLSLL